MKDAFGPARQQVDTGTAHVAGRFCGNEAKRRGALFVETNPKACGAAGSDLAEQSHRREIGRTNPIGEIGRTNPIDEIGRTNPIDEIGRTNPIDEIGRTKPIVRVWRRPKLD